MPNISEYNAPPNLGLQPTETGVESTARAGLRIGAFYNQEGQALDNAGQRVGQGIKNIGDAAVQYMEHREVSAGAAHGADLIANLNQSWNDTAKNADPNDVTVAAKWRAETLEPALDQFHEGFQTEGGQQWAEGFVDKYRQHSVIKTAADMSSLAADAVHINALKTVNGLATAAFNDPSTADFARDTLAHSLDGVISTSPNLSADDAGKVKQQLTFQGEQQIVKGAIMGAIVKGGDWHKIADDPKNAPYVNAPEMQQFERQDQYYKRMAENEDKHAQAQQDHDQKAAATDTEKKIISSLIPDGEQPVQPADLWKAVKQYGTMPGATAAGMDKLVKDSQQAIKRLSQPDPVTVKGNYDALASRLLDPDNPLTVHDIVQNQANLSNADMKKLKWSVGALQTEELNDPLLKNALTGAKQIIQGTLPAEKMMSAGKYAAFVNDFLPAYLSQKRGGTLPPNALDMNDPKSFISQKMASYKGAMADVLTNSIAAGGGVGAPTPLPTYTAPKPGAGFKPPAGWQTNGKMYRDPDGKLYDLSGKPVS